MSAFDYEVTIGRLGRSQPLAVLRATHYNEIAKTFELAGGRDDLADALRRLGDEAQPATITKAFVGTVSLELFTPP